MAIANYATSTDFTTAETKVGEVEQELNQLIHLREVLGKQHEELEQRLRGVLAQRVENGNPPAQPEQVRVPLAQALHNEVRMLSELSDGLQSTINRIEL